MAQMRQAQAELEASDAYLKMSKAEQDKAIADLQA